MAPDDGPVPAETVEDALAGPWPPPTQLDVLGDCEGACDILTSNSREEHRVAYHDKVIEVLCSLDLEKLAWLLGELEIAGECMGLALYPHELEAAAAQHDLPRPVFAERVCSSLARAYRKELEP